ncbi:MAG TPA: lipopolysaccharide assembly protein LapA domain-containing protein [Vineibacter sp.]|nr:lipopolysaccharide assembly protein LapA domain-containing protein [Vineibacter sp.]
MKILSRIALGIVLLLGALIAVSNTAPVELRLWPFTDFVVMPLYLAIVLLLLVGVLVGLTMGWVSGRNHRRLSRERRREAERLAGEVTQLRADIAARDKAAKKEAAAAKEPAVAEVRALERQQALVDPEGMDPARARG